MFPERFSNLPAHAFSRLRVLLDGLEPGGDVVQMTIGDPEHPFPGRVTDEIVRHADGFNSYPPNEGTPELRAAYAGWLNRRFGVDVDPDTRVMPVNGTREGLYNACMAFLPETKGGDAPYVLSPNPFYQVYMVSALSVAAQPCFVNATEATGHLPDFMGLPKDVLNRTAAAYICSPANPQGAVADAGYWRDLLNLAETHDFKIFADECYSEIYRGTAPTGVLTVAADMGADPERVVAFHSLSKRSNLPGLRSGFVTSGPETIKRARQLRSYAGTPLPLPLQRAAEKVWADEAHVEENRALYLQKFELADEIFGGMPGYLRPQAGFFLWLPVDDCEAATVKLWTETGVKVLPGAYLAQTAHGVNPGQKYIRAAMVAPLEQTRVGLRAIRACLYG